MPDPTVQEWSKCRGCRVSLSSSNEVFSLGELCVSDFTPKTALPPPKIPLTLIWCPRCGLVQSRFSLPYETLYTKYWYRSGVTQTMRDELADVVAAASRRVVFGPNDRVLDIGANDGTLLKNYPATVRRVALEPAETFKTCNDGVDIRLLDLYDAGGPTKYGPFKVITAVAMFYDLNDPVGVLRRMASDLTPDGVLVIQMNYLWSMLAQTAFDNIEHEHVAYYSLHTLVRLAEAAGLYLEHAETRPVNGGSLRAFFRRKPVKSSPTVERLLAAEREEEKLLRVHFQRFDTAVRMIHHAVQCEISKTRVDGILVKGLGASTRGNTLLQRFELGGSLREIGERDKNKVGLYTVGTQIPIVSEEKMRESPALVLVMPWHFRKEILAREAPYLQSGATFLFPLPRPQVASWNRRSGENPITWRTLC